MVAIDAGGVFTCALTGSGDMFCWGDGSSDRFAGDAQACIPTPAQIEGVAGVLALAAGEYHLCAVREDGGVACWGSITTERATTPEDPLLVLEIGDGILQIGAGAGYQCILTRTGGVSCWGDNGFGQLGDGSDRGRHTPVIVAGLSEGAVAIALGSGHACALVAGGEIRCWGDPSSGQLGDGTLRWR